MKKTALLLVLVIGITIQMSSQSYKPKWGEVHKKEGGIYLSFRLLNIEDDHYNVLMRHAQKGDKILKYDMNHNLVWNKKIELKFQGREIQLGGILKTKNGSYGYMSIMDKKSEQIEIFSGKFKDGSFSDIKALYKHDYKALSYMQRAYVINTNSDLININYKALSNTQRAYLVNPNIDLIGFIQSKDKNHFVYTHSISGKDENSEEQIGFAVFDADMNLVWDKIQKFNYTDNVLTIVQSAVSNNGEIYLLAQSTKQTNPSVSAGFPFFEYKIFRITKDNIDEFEVNIGEYISPADAILEISEDAIPKIILTGFYSDDDRKAGYRGLFYASGDGISGIENVKTHKFDKAFLEQILSEKDMEKGYGLSSNFSVKDVFTFSDGTFSFIAEEYYVTSSTSRSSVGNSVTSSTSRTSVGNSVTTTYNYGSLPTYKFHSYSIIIPRFTSEGELLNILELPKASIGSMDASSYVLSKYNDKLYFIFNGFKTDEERKKMKLGNRYQYADLVVVNAKCEIEYSKPLFNNNDDIGLEFSRSISNYSNSKILIGRTDWKKKKYAFGVINLKQ